MQTRGEQMLALRRRRMAAAPPFFRGGFRPFFFGGTVWAVVALSIWLTVMAGGAQLHSTFDPLSWHRHEMLFGFVGAIVGGFLLTAVPNWTGRLPIAGPPLMALFLLWFAARLAILFSALLGALPAAILDVGFYWTLAFVAAREVLEAKNRNLPIVGLIFLFGVVCACDHVAAAGFIDHDEVPWKLGVSLVIVMISVIGGRIIPSFTRNWLAKKDVREGLPAQPGRFDLAAIVLTIVAFMFWILAPAGAVTGTVCAIGALAQLVRLARWKGWLTAADALVLILHVGYLWVPIGLALLAAINFGAAFPQSVAVHALTAGAMSTMILAVMSRATLGHTGRELCANGPTQLAYVLITAGAALRVAASAGWFDYRIVLEAAGAAWMAAFGLFGMVYWPMLFKARVGDPNG